MTGTRLTRRGLLGFGSATVGGAWLAACTGGPAVGPALPSDAPTGTAVTASPGAGAAAPQARVIRTVASGLSVPWGLGFLPDGSALVTERDSGRVLAVSGAGAVRQVGALGSDEDAGGESGLLGLAVSPSFARDGQVFVYVTTGDDNRILRTTYDGSRLGRPEVVLDGIPRGPIHDGGRLAFGPDRMLYASTGETGERELAQDLDSLAGKILRLTPDGDPAAGNPFDGSPVWSYGHRNVQGLAWDDQDRLWASEFGASDYDELNRIVAGADYGWPGTEGSGGSDAQPAVVWPTDDASPSGLAFAAGHLWLGALRGTRLWRVTVSGQAATDPTDHFVGAYGRLRTVVASPTGTLWVTTSNRDGRGDPAADDDRILEVAVA